MKTFKNVILKLFITTNFFVSHSQNFTASFIKTVTINKIENSNPIVPFGTNLRFEFDDLEADQKTYRYHIQHCDYDWEPSNLQATEYIEGFQNFEILNMDNSFGTYQNYTHHYFSIPNINTRIKRTGNYLITILNEYDEICIQRRIVYHKSIVLIPGTVERDRNLKNIDENQVVQFSILHPNLNINNPDKELKVQIIQNNDWNFCIKDIKPQFYKKDEIAYTYNDQTSFKGNNEYLNFDTKNFNTGNVNIIRSVIENHYYNTYLSPNFPRASAPYTYYPDINGAFLVRTLNGEIAALDSEYTNVHFHLKPYERLTKGKDIYVYGAFNNYATNEENLLVLNKDTGYYETEMLFKQGFYNYTFASKNKKEEIEIASIEGSYWQTENDYTILVYYIPFGERTYQIIGAATINSKN